MMMKKIVSFVAAISVLVCGVGSVRAAEASASGAVIYDMLEHGTWQSTTSVVSTDAVRFPDRGEVVVANVGTGAGVTLYDGFDEPLRNGKVKFSFEFFADEAYSGYPQFYVSLANMVPFDRTQNWLCTPAFFPQMDGTVKYYGGRGSTGSIDWNIYDTTYTIEKGRWYKMETIVDFDSMGKISGYLEGDKLYELNGSTAFTGFLFVITGKSGSSGKLYFDNVTVSNIQNDLSAKYAYGEADNIVVEFNQPITAANAADVKAIDIKSGKTVDVLETKQVSGNKISYKMPHGDPYAEYRLIFGDKNLSDYGSKITGSLIVNGAVGVTDEYRLVIPKSAVLLEDSFNYTKMNYASDSLTLNSSIWSRTGDSSNNSWWGMGALVSGDKKLQIHNFHGDAGSVRGAKGKIANTAVKSDVLDIVFDLSYDDAEPTDGNYLRIDLGTYPILKVAGESVSVYENQNKAQEPTALTQITKANDAAASKYELSLNFNTGKISAKIGDTVLSDITMCDGLKANGIADISFMGCKAAAINRSIVCNCALIDDLKVVHKYNEYDNYPGVTGIRFIEESGDKKVALDTVSPLTAKIAVNFSKAVTAKLEDISLTGENGEIVCSGEWKSEENSYVLTVPQRALSVKSKYTISVPNTITDANGNGLACAYTCDFKTGSNTRTVNIAYINEFIQNNDKQGLADLIELDPEGIGIASIALSAADCNAVAENIIDYAGGNLIADSDETVKDLQKLVVMDCVNNRRTTNVWSEDLTYGVSDISVFELMEKRLGGYITAQLSGKKLATTEAYDDALLESAIICAINYADGKERVKSILTEFESVISGGGSLNLTDEKCAAIYEKGDFTSLGSIKSFADTYVPEGSGTTPGSGLVNGGLGFGGGGGGGFVSSSTDKAANAADNKVYNGGENEKEEVKVFDDIEDYPWAEEAINELFAKGVINGKDKNIFAPGDNVLREETAKIIVEAFKFYIKGSINFDDVNKDDWFYPFIVRAYSCGIVNGISETSFGSGQPIIRQDLAVMVYNAMNEAGVLATLEGDGKFIDEKEISDYAYDAVYALKNEGIISGDENGAFNPNGFASRAETAKIIYLATKYLK